MNVHWTAFITAQLLQILRVGLQFVKSLECSDRVGYTRPDRLSELPGNISDSLPYLGTKLWLVGTELVHPISF